MEEKLQILEKGFHHYKRNLKKRFCDNNHRLNLAETAFQIKGRKNFYSLKLTPLQLQKQNKFIKAQYMLNSKAAFLAFAREYILVEFKNYILYNESK